MKFNALALALILFSLAPLSLANNGPKCGPRACRGEEVGLPDCKRGSMQGTSACWYRDDSWPDVVMKCVKNKWKMVKQCGQKPESRCVSAQEQPDFGVGVTLSCGYISIGSQTPYKLTPYFAF
ncbi:hypothetical protein FB567DRAFT_543428 [Paraphoma chrysanthemicola]|uniref:Uncharacterized protein n=1 Tax=Paraphoma chrysanthemicola TaxID=798071 RepID=A0A8K0RJN0_9PLEO|nr:hypothetical protein FB567DRAFT_543428 [Paraphoma chrysanthemicola]